MVRDSQYADDTRALSLKVLDVRVRDGIITQVKIKWDSRTDTDWVLSEQVSKISQNRQTRSGGIPAVMSIPASTAVEIKWEGKVCEAEVIEFLPEGKGTYKEKSYIVGNPSDVDGPEWEAEVPGTNIIRELRLATEKSPSPPPKTKRKLDTAPNNRKRRIPPSSNGDNAAATTSSAQAKTRTWTRPPPTYTAGALLPTAMSRQTRCR